MMKGKICIRTIFPEEILKKLDLSTLTVDNNSYIDEELKEHFSDIVYTLKEISEKGGD